MSHADLLYKHLFRGIAETKMKMKMKKSKITKNTNSSMKTKIIKSFCLIFLLFSCTSAFSKKVEVSCSENDAQIYINGQLQGRGKVVLAMRKNSPLVVQIKKVGFLTDEFTINYGNGISPERSYYRILIKDDAFEASSSTDQANIDIDVKTSKTEDKAWKLLSEVITSYFDILEVTDKSTGYIRTSWAVQSFKGSTIRTRVIIKTSSSDNSLKYKIKILSEIADKPNTSVKDDEKFKQWDRVLKKYSDLVPELQIRLK